MDRKEQRTRQEVTVTRESIEGLIDTVQKLYLADEIPWVVGYSGGKDSTAAFQLVWIALQRLKPEERIKTVHVINTDTLVESPVVAEWAQRSLNCMEQSAQEQQVPFVMHKLTPKVENTFWVNLIGKGYPYPRKRFRWCTDRMKIRPVNDFIRERIAEHGEIVMVLGTRKAESASRAKSMTFYEKKRVRELLSPNPTLANELVFSPLAEWNDNDVWVFLMQYENPWGYSNQNLLTLYQGATEDGECPLMNEKDLPSCGKSRFGCWVCTMVEQDKSMQAMITNDEEKQWMTPLLDLRNYIGDETKDWSRRDFRKMGGFLQGYKEKLSHGPYLKETREDFLRELLEKQKIIRRLAPEEYKDTQLISLEELKEIRRIWVQDKHEFDDSLPRIYREVMGVEFPDSHPIGPQNFGQAEWEELKHVCEAEYPEEKQIFELLYTMLDIENRAGKMDKRKDVLEALEVQIGKNFYKDETDAAEYYFTDMRRKRSMGATYVEQALDEDDEEIAEEMEEEENGYDY